MLGILQTYLWVFSIGGFICMLGQILLIKTKITSGRILVLFVVIEAVLESLDLYEPIVKYAIAVTIILINSLGRSLAKVAIDGVREMGLIGIFSGTLSATSADIACAEIFAYLLGLIFSSKTKNNYIL